MVRENKMLATANQNLASAYGIDTNLLDTLVRDALARVRGVAAYPS